MPSSKIAVKQKGDIPAILAHLRETCAVDGDRVSWKLPAFEHWFFALLCAIRFDPDLPDVLKDSFVQAALSDCALKRQFSQPYFIRRVQERAQAELAKTAHRYTTISQLNYPCSKPHPNSVASCFGRVHLKKRLSKRYREAIQAESLHLQVRYNFKEDDIYLLCPVSATNFHSALEKGYESFTGTSCGNTGICLTILPYRPTTSVSSMAGTSRG